MIPRYQKIIFAILLLASVAMGVVLWQLRERAHKRLLAGEASAPTQAPQVAPNQQATLVVASDSDNSMIAQVQSLPLPADPGARARAILGKLLDLYTAPGSAHPVSGGNQGVAQVFLMPAPGEHADAQLAVVDLTGTFVASHPSGLETENLTVLSICATLRANLPNVTQVRFLVDGQTRPTLAGHADLTDTFLTADAVPTQESKP